MVLHVAVCVVCIYRMCLLSADNIVFVIVMAFMTM